MDSRGKGIRGELEWRDFLRRRGYWFAERGQQRAGGGDSPDVIGGPTRVHFEVKRREGGNVFSWLKQAQGDAKAGKMPAVAHRRNKEPWLVTIDADAFLDLIRELELMYDGPVEK